MSGQFNVFRKIFHFSGIIYAVIYYTDLLHAFPAELFLENTRSVLFYALFTAYLFMVVFEFLRFRYVFFQNLFISIAGKILKPNEISKTHGSMPFFFGLAFCTAFFLKEISIVAALYLMIGDPCAAWFGGRYGKHKLYNGKSYEGLVAGILGAFITGCAFLLINNALYPDNFFSVSLRTHPVLLLGAFFLSSTAAFIAELFSSNGFFDDNFLIPGITALSLSLLLYVFFNLEFHVLFFSMKDLLIPLS